MRRGQDQSSRLATLRSVTDDVCVVRASGEIDLQTVADLDSALTEAQRDGHTHVLLDLWDVTFIDSVGLGILLSAHRRAEKGIGGFAVVAEPGGVIQTAFELTGLSATLSVYSTPAFAKSMLRGAASELSPTEAGHEAREAS